MLPFFISQFWQRMLSERVRKDDTRKRLPDTPATQPFIKSERSGSDDINTLFKTYYHLETQYNALLKSPMTIFIIEDSPVARRLKEKQVKKIFFASSDLRIVNVVSAEKAIKQLQVCHAKGQPPLLIFIDRSFFLEDKVTDRAETEVLKEIKRLYGESVGIVSISNEYATEKTEKAEAQAGKTPPEEIHLATNKNVHLENYQKEIKSRILKIIKEHNKPRYLPVSNPMKTKEEKGTATIISTTPQDKTHCRRRSLPVLDQAVRPSQRGDKSVPATLRRKNLDLTECTIMLIGEKRNETRQIQTLLSITFERVDNLRFIMATDLKEANESFSILHREKNPPDLVFTVNCQQHSLVKASVNALFANVEIARSMNGETENLEDIYQRMVLQALRQEKSVCLERSEVAVASP